MDIDPKEVMTKRVTATGQVSHKPCLIFNLCGVGITGVNNTFRVYDGFGTGDEHKLTLEAGQYEADNRPYFVPLFFSRGLYVVFVVGGDEFFAQIYEFD